MIDFAAEHIGFVIASYAIVATVLLALVTHVLWRSGKLKQELRAQNLAEPGARPEP
jgi:heme exporter protein CcmD